MVIRFQSLLLFVVLALPTASLHASVITAGVASLEFEIVTALSSDPNGPFDFSDLAISVDFDKTRSRKIETGDAETISRGDTEPGGDRNNLRVGDTIVISATSEPRMSFVSSPRTSMHRFDRSSTTFSKEFCTPAIESPSTSSPSMADSTRRHHVIWLTLIRSCRTQSSRVSAMCEHHHHSITIQHALTLAD